jgi:uncharacterized protein (DUF4415 family)
LGSDLKKVDAHTVTPEEYAEIPELDDEWFGKAQLHEAGKPVRRGRPPSDQRKQVVSLRLDPEIVEAFRASGSGWMTRMNDVLKHSVPAEPPTVRKRSSAPSIKVFRDPIGAWRISDDRVFGTKGEAIAYAKAIGKAATEITKPAKKLSRHSSTGRFSASSTKSRARGGKETA